MAEVWFGEGNSGTCAGSPITSSRHNFSNDLIHGCKYFSEMAITSEDCEETLYANTACILFSTSVIESQVNEWISLSAELKDDDESSFWCTLEGMQKSMKIDEKWNLIASHNNTNLWDNSKEPFQSYQTITSLRNELVHYKGTFFAKDEAPNKKIKELMKKFKAETKASFIGDDVSSWVYELLIKKDLGVWVYERTNQFRESFFELLLKKP